MPPISFVFASTKSAIVPFNCWQNFRTFSLLKFENPFRGSEVTVLQVFFKKLQVLSWLVADYYTLVLLIGWKDLLQQEGSNFKIFFKKNFK